MLQSVWGVRFIFLVVVLTLLLNARSGANPTAIFLTLGWAIFVMLSVIAENLLLKGD